MQNTPYMMVLLGEFNANAIDMIKQTLKNSYREYFIAMWIVPGHK